MARLLTDVMEGAGFAEPGIHAKREWDTLHIACIYVVVENSGRLLGRKPSSNHWQNSTQGVKANCKYLAEIPQVALIDLTRTHAVHAVQETKGKVGERL